MALADTTKYTSKGSLTHGLLRMGGVVNPFFTKEKAFSHVSSHANLLALFINMSMGFILSASLSMNLDSEVNLSTSLCTSLKFWGLCICSKALDLLEFASIPWLVSKSPRNFHPFTLNTHFLRLNLMLNSCNMPKISYRLQRSV